MAGAAAQARRRRDDGPMRCEVCGSPVDGFAGLAGHLVEQAARSDGAHVMWLNRSVTKRRVSADELRDLLERRTAGVATGEERVQR